MSKRKLKVKGASEGPGHSGRVNETALMALASSILNSGISRSDFRKAQILESVIRIASQEGFEAISFDRIGRDLGLQKSNVAYYFGSKEEMIQRAMYFSTTKIFAYSADGLGKAESGGAQLKAYIEAHFNWLRSNFNHACFLLLIYTRSPVDEAARTFTKNSRENGRRKIIQILRNVLKEGACIKKQEILAYAEFIQDQLTGALLQLVGQNGAPTHKEIENKQNHVEKMLSNILKITL